MTRGVSLLVVGKPSYARFYANMALSIRKHSPDLKIQAIFEKGLSKHLYPFLQVWDELTIIDNDDCYDLKGNLDPGKAKISLYKYYKYDETIYLDVDGIIVKDITPLFEQERDFIIQKDAMHWANNTEIITHFKLDPASEIFGSNSSIQFIRKGKQTETIYKEAVKAMREPLPLNKQSNSWFGRQPDELYFSIGMAKAGIIDPYFEGWPVYFRNRMQYGQAINLHDIIKDHYAIGSYGSDRFNHKSVRQNYDSQNKVNWNELVNLNPYNEYKHFYLMKKKHNK